MRRSVLFVMALACGACRTRSVAPPPVVAAQPTLATPPAAPPPRGIEADFESVTMASDTVGWALNQWGDVARTEDGGDTFRHTPGDFKRRGEDGSIESLVVGSERVAWVVEEPRGFEEGYRASAWIHRTSDGGKTWSTTTIATRFGGRTARFTASLSGEKLGFVTVTSEFNTEVPIELVFRTTDGGKSFASLGQSPTLDVITARSDSIAMARQDPLVGNTNEVFRTTNGGRSWTPIRLPSASRTDIGSGGVIAFFGPDLAFAGMLGTSAENNVVLYRSDDAGTSWHIDATLRGVDLCSGHVSAYGAFAAVRSSTQRLYRSFRHGIWDDIGDLPGECDHRLQAIDDHLLFVTPVAGHRGMWRSRDGGRHWTEIGRKID